MQKQFEKALSQFGIKEISGDKDNPEVLKYFNDLGFDGNQLKDETAWCAAFANWCLKEAGCEYQNKLNARSLLEVGCAVSEPEIGDITVFWRGSKDSWQGHVAFFVRETQDYIYVLGGNQGNEVSIKPYLKSRLLGYRRV